MCRGLFGGNQCEWIIWVLIIWFILNSMCNDDCGSTYSRNSGCGCGCD